MTVDEKNIFNSISGDQNREKKLEFLLNLYNKNSSDYDVLFYIIKVLGTYPKYRQRAKELMELMKYNYDPIVVSYELGKLDIYDKKYDDAIANFKEAIFLNPRDNSSKLEIAKAYIKLGDDISAKKYLLELADLKQDKAAFYELGLMAEREEDFDKACMYYKKVLSMKKYDIRSLVRIGLIEYKEGNIALAKEYFGRGYEIDSNDVYILTELSKCERSLGNINKAKEYIDKAVMLNGGGVSLFEKALVYEALGDYEEVYNAYEELQAIEERPAASYKFGILLKQSGNYERAKEELQKCIGTRLDDKVFMILADICLKEGDINKAREYISKVNTTLLSSSDYKSIVRVDSYIDYKNDIIPNDCHYYLDQIMDFDKEKTFNVSKQFFSDNENLESLYEKAKLGIKDENHFDTISAEDLYLIDLDAPVRDDKNVSYNRLMALTPVNSKDIIAFMPTYKKLVRFNNKNRKLK